MKNVVLLEKEEYEEMIRENEKLKQQVKQLKEGSMIYFETRTKHGGPFMKYHGKDETIRKLTLMYETALRDAINYGEDKK